ncbi:MAG: hypothetical protein WCE81_05045, partial [Halobacteriota archaeon]
FGTQNISIATIDKHISPFFMFKRIIFHPYFLIPTFITSRRDKSTSVVSDSICLFTEIHRTVDCP